MYIKKLLFLRSLLSVCFLNGQTGNSVQFIETSTKSGINILYNSDPTYPKMGNIQSVLTIPLAFESTFYNIDSVAITEIYLKAEIINNTNLLTDSVFSSTTNILSPNDTLILITDSIRLWECGSRYELSLSFSLNYKRNNIKHQVSYGDTILINTSVSNVGPDYNNLSNIFDSRWLGDDGVGIINKIVLEKIDPNILNLDLDSIRIYLSDSTIVGGDIIVELYDTANFDTINGFGGPPILSESFTINQSKTGWVTLVNSFSSSQIGSGTYYMATYFFTNGGANPIFFGNDNSQKIAKNDGLYFDLNGFRWYSNSTRADLSLPMIRLYFEESGHPCGISLKESLELSIKVYPNPVRKSFVIKADYLKYEDVEVKLYDLTGKLVLSQSLMSSYDEISVSSLKSGIYQLNILDTGQIIQTEKLVIQ